MLKVTYLVILLIVSLIALVAIIKAITLAEDLEDAHEKMTHLICENSRLRHGDDGHEDNNN